MHKKKTWTTYFVYAFRGIAKHLCSHFRVKAHAIGVSIRAFTLDCFQFWRNLRKARI